MASPPISLPTMLEQDSSSASCETVRTLTWVLSNDRAIAARVDTPQDNKVHGAVIVVPSIGQEAVVSFRTTRSLTMHAARAGFVGITFDFSGHGDSHPLPPAADAVGAWLEDLEAVMAFAAEILGDDRPVHLVGLRVGAALLRLLPPRGAGHRLLWEPISGAAYLRQHRTIRRHTVAVPAVSDMVELEGYALSPEHARSLKRLPAPRPTSPPRRGETIRFEPDPQVARRLALGSLYRALLPLQQIREIVASLEPGDAGSVAAWQPLRTALLPLSDGSVVEEILCDVGPKRLSAVLARPVARPCSLALVLTAMGSETKSGPGALWSDCARSLAKHGVLSLRIDRSGLGEGIDPCLIDEPRPYRDASVDDIGAAVNFIRTFAKSPGMPIWASGICAGAWCALRAAESGGLSRVLAINSIHWNPDANVYTEAFYERFHGQDSAPSATPQATHGAMGVRLLALIRKKVATNIPWLSSMVHSEIPFETVSMLLSRLPLTCRVDLIMGIDEGRSFRGKGGSLALFRARRRGLVANAYESEKIDHALMSEMSRREVSRILEQACIEAVGVHVLARKC